MTLDLLDEQQAYIDWLRSEHSCLLLLSGVTMAGGRLQGGTATYSWLSPATIYIAERIQQEQKVLAYYCCHPELRADERPAVADVIPSIIFQILMRKPDILRHKYPSFLSIVSEWQQHVQKSKDDRRLINLMVKLLREVLAEFKDTGMVYIILDRVDQCSCRTRYLMDELAKLDFVRLVVTARPDTKLPQAGFVFSLPQTAKELVNRYLERREVPEARRAEIAQEQQQHGADEAWPGQREGDRPED